MTTRLTITQVSHGVTELVNTSNRLALYDGYLGPVGTSVWLEPYKVTVPTDPGYRELAAKFYNVGTSVPPKQETKNENQKES